MYIKLKLKICL